MWLWQLNAYKKNRFWLRLVAVSCAAHLILLFLVLFVYRGYLGSHTIDVAKNIPANAKIVVLPFYKVAPKALHTASAALKKTAIPELPNVPEVAKRVAPLAIPAPASEPVQEVVSKTTVSSAGARKRTQKKRIEKKKPAKKTVKKAAPEKKLVPQPKVVEQPVVPEIVAQPIAADSVPIAMAIDADAVYVGTEEAQALLMQQEIKTEVERCWQPPAGLPADLMCHINVIVEWDGTLGKMDVVKKSGVLMYDISAREAVTAMTFPKITWGKDLTIVFNQ